MCTDGANCRRKVCWFAHTANELRSPSSTPTAAGHTSSSSSSAFGGSSSIATSSSQQAAAAAHAAAAVAAGLMSGSSSGTTSLYDQATSSSGTSSVTSYLMSRASLVGTPTTCAGNMLLAQQQQLQMQAGGLQQHPHAQGHRSPLGAVSPNMVAAADLQQHVQLLCAPGSPLLSPAATAHQLSLAPPPCGTAHTAGGGSGGIGGGAPAHLSASGQLMQQLQRLQQQQEQHGIQHSHSHGRNLHQQHQQQVAMALSAPAALPPMFSGLAGENSHLAVPVSIAPMLATTNNPAAGGAGDYTAVLATSTHQDNGLAASINPLAGLLNSLEEQALQAQLDAANAQAAAAAASNNLQAVLTAFNALSVGPAQDGGARGGPNSRRNSGHSNHSAPLPQYCMAGSVPASSVGGGVYFPPGV